MFIRRLIRQNAISTKRIVLEHVPACRNKRKGHPAPPVRNIGDLHQRTLLSRAHLPFWPRGSLSLSLSRRAWCFGLAHLWPFHEFKRID
ncbi:hypothetical protein NL676_022708 [Syzygium grande]|nr:hypothetical protein NL676_022708 [Syzygium grande]